MPRGGFRPNQTGRPPAAQSTRKDRERARVEKGLPAKTARQMLIDDGTWLTLPRDGRGGNPPAWPLSKPSKPTAQSRRELVLWRQLWKRPQAVGWEHVGAEHQVAMYVRALVRAEEPDSPAAWANLVRLQADALGLTAVGLHMLKWRIARFGGDATADAQPPAVGWNGRPAYDGGPSHDEHGRPNPTMSVKQRIEAMKAEGAKDRAARMGWFDHGPGAS